MKTKSCRILSVIMVLALILSGIIPAAGAFAADTLRVAKILDFYGDVQVMKAGGEKAFKAFKGMGLTKGDKIITGQQAWALLEVGSDSEMKLAENTQLSITELAASLENNTENTSVSLWAGATYTNVKKKLSPGSKYEIKTPTAVMGVRGTQFVTSHKNGMTVVTALSGEVTVTITQTILDPDGTERQEHVEVVLQKDQQLTRSEEASQPADYNLDDLKLEDMDLFTLEVIQEVSRREPGLINPQILTGLEQKIEQKKEEEQTKQQQTPPPPQNPQLVYEGDSGSDGGPGGGTPLMLELTELTNVSMTVGGTTTKSIVTSPQADTINVSADPENIVTFSVMGNTLNINGYSIGTTTITVTAQKSGYTSASRTFDVTVTEPVLEQVAAPSAYPEPGTYNEAQCIELLIDTDGATIWYTTDGSNPKETSESRQQYEYGINIDSDTTIKAYAEKQGMTDSDVVDLEYVIQIPYGAMSNTRVAENNSGFLAVYEKETDPETTGIFGRLIDETGHPGLEFAVSDGEGDANEPAIARDSEGNYLVVWSDCRGTGAAAIYGQLINSEGTLMGSNFLIDATSGFNNLKPAVAYDYSNLRYLVVWEEYEYPGDWQGEIYGRFVEDNGTLSGERRLLVHKLWSQYDPQIAYHCGEGKYLLVFTDSNDIKGQLINADGTLAGGIISIAAASQFQMRPDVIADPADNRFLVVWQDSRITWECNIYGQFVDVTDGGQDLTPNNFIINNASGEQINPAAVLLGPEGGYLIAWEDQSGENSAIKGQRLNTSGEVSGEPFVIAGEAGEYCKPALALNIESNKYLAAYEDNNNNPVTIGYKVGETISTQLEIQSQTLAAGTTHSLVVQNGQVWSTGYSRASSTLKLSLVSGLSNVAAVSANKYYSLALKTDGSVWAWGENEYGQLGNGLNTVDSMAPAQVSGLSGIVAVSAGECHALALKNDGTVWAWGDRSDYKLGDGSDDGKALTPTQVMADATSPLTGIIAIGAGYAHSLVLKDDGTVWAWGDNASGQAGQGTGGGDAAYPVKVKDSNGTGYLTGVTAITAGPMHNLALKGGNVLSWGSNYVGQLGYSTSTGNTLLPVQISGLTGITKIAAGGNWAGHNLALNSSGQVYAWGDGLYGQLGNGGTSSITPIQVPGLSTVTEIAAGGEYGTSLFKQSDGTVKACGFNDCGELGDGTETQRNSVVVMNYITPTTPPELADIIVHNYATGSDNIRIDSSGIIRAYDAATGGNLLGEGEGIEGSVYICLDGSFDRSLTHVYITRQVSGYMESERVAKAIPLPQLCENDDYSINQYEQGYGRMSFYITLAQVQNLKDSLGLGSTDPITIRAFVGKALESSITELPDINNPDDMALVDVITITPDHPAGIGKEPGNYPYAVAVYDCNGAVLAQYLSGTAWETVESSFDSISPNIICLAPLDNEVILLTLEQSESTTFTQGIQSSHVTLDGALTGLSHNIEWIDNKQVILNLTGTPSLDGEGIIRISKDALSEDEDNPSVDIYATVQVLPGEIACQY